MNSLKESCVPTEFTPQPQEKKFELENETHTSYSNFILEYLGVNLIFNIIPNNFPISEDGIVGLCFFKNTTTIC